MSRRKPTSSSVCSLLSDLSMSKIELLSERETRKKDREFFFIFHSQTAGKHRSFFQFPVGVKTGKMQELTKWEKSLSKLQTEEEVGFLLLIN